MMTLKIGIVSLNTILHYLIKWKIYIPCNTAVSGYTQEKFLHVNTRRMFMIARFTMFPLAKTCQQSNCTTTGTVMLYTAHNEISYSG